MASRSALVVGVANARSIAWASACALLGRNFDVVVTYQNERFRKTVEELVSRKNDAILSAASSAVADDGSADGCNAPRLRCLPCDVSREDDVRNLFTSDLPPLLRRPRLDAMIHCAAYAPPDAMKEGTLLGTSREAFNTSHCVSAYSLISVARHGLPLLSAERGLADASGGDTPTVVEEDQGYSSIVALSYLGASRAVPNYNVMGPAKASLESIVRGLAAELGPDPHRVRVNAVSAGPVNTLAARGIRGFTDMRKDAAERSMMRRNVEAQEVAEVVSFLASEGSSGVTGQTIFVDGGYSSMAGPPSHLNR